MAAARIQPTECRHSRRRLWMAAANLDQIADKGYSLAIPLYVSGDTASDAGKNVDVADALVSWRGAADATERTVADALNLLRAEMGA